MKSNEVLYPLKLRKLEINDSENILSWRNDLETVSNSTSGAPVSRDEHMNWIKNRIEKGQVSFIGIDSNDLDICFIFFTPSSTDTLEVSINLNPIFRGQGFGKKFLNMALASPLISGKRIRAIILSHNIRSINMFASLEFYEVNSDQTSIKVYERVLSH